MPSGDLLAHSLSSRPWPRSEGFNLLRPTGFKKQWLTCHKIVLNAVLAQSSWRVELNSNLAPVKNLSFIGNSNKLYRFLFISLLFWVLSFYVIPDVKHPVICIPGNQGFAKLIMVLLWLLFSTPDWEHCVTWTCSFQQKPLAAMYNSSNLLCSSPSVFCALMHNTGKDNSRCLSEGVLEKLFSF